MIEYLKSQLAQKYELVVLKQSSASICKNQVRNTVDQIGNAFIKNICRLRKFNSVLKDRVECLERKLIQHVDLVEIVKNEVEEAGSGRHRPVGFSRLVYLRGSQLRLDRLRLDLAGSLLRSFKVLHKCDVTQDIGTRRRQS